MNKHLQMVREFHTAFGLQVSDLGSGSVSTEHYRVLRSGMIMEEYSETIDALCSDNSVGVLDGLVDTAYFALGGLAELGKDVQDIPESFMEIFKPVGGWSKIDFSKRLLLACGLGSTELLFLSDLKESTDGLSELYWTCVYLTESHLGLDFDKAFTEIHRSNMSKLDENGNPVILASGKRGKSSLYSPPDLLKLFPEEES